MEINESLIKERLEICHSCSIYSTNMGGICNNKLWINPENNDASTKYYPGYIQGCGCIINSKVKNPMASCVANKW